MGKSVRTQQELSGNIAAALGAKIVYDIPLTADLENILISLSGGVTLADAATALKRDGIAEIIASVDLVADGKKTLVSVPFAQLVQGNIPRRVRLSEPTLTQPGLTAAAQTFLASGVLDCSAFGAMRPKDSSVRETRYKTLQLVVRFAASWDSVFSDVVSYSATTLTLIVKTNETVESADASGNVSTPLLVPSVSYREEAVSALANKNRFRLTPEQVLRGLTLVAIDSTGNVKSDAVLGRVRIYTGKTLRLDLAAATIRADNLASMVSVIPAGYYYLDLARSGGSVDRLNDCYDLRTAVLQGADAYLEFDSLAAMTLGVTQFGYESA